MSSKPSSNSSNVFWPITDQCYIFKHSYLLHSGLWRLLERLLSVVRMECLTTVHRSYAVPSMVSIWMGVLTSRRHSKRSKRLCMVWKCNLCQFHITSFGYDPRSNRLKAEALATQPPCGTAFAWVTIHRIYGPTQFPIPPGLINKDQHKHGFWSVSRCSLHMRTCMHTALVWNVWT